MRTKFSGILTLLLAFVVQFTFAQEKTVSGTVTDDKGLPLPGVNIVVKNTATGTQTDFDGNYSIETNKGAVLTFSYVGFSTKEMVVGDGDTINIQLEAAASELEEVVVTAQGISRQKKALGYAVTTIAAESIEESPERDLARVLTGKVAGVAVTSTGGTVGSGTNIIIRGQSSINQSNQPLFIVDGVPFNSDTNDQAGFGDGGAVTSSRFLDLDPNNIVSVNVLKGLSATVLYGQLGRNGVILITTKNGSQKDVNKKFEITAIQSVSVNKIANLPDYQNTYGQGGDQVANPGFVGNWGARFDSNQLINHPYNSGRLNGVFPQFAGLQIPYEAAEDNVKDFFRDGIGTTTSINVASTQENTKFNANFGLSQEDGFIPGNEFRRVNFGIGGSAKLSNKFTVSGTGNFVLSDFKTPPIAASNALNSISVFTRTLFIPRNLDLTNLPFQDPVTGASVYYRTDQENPLWLVENSGFTQETRRFFGSNSINYAVTDNFSINYRVGLDTFTENQSFFVNKGGVSAPQYQIGYLRNTSGVNTIWDHTLSFNLNNVDLTESIGLNALVGFNPRRDVYEQTGVVNTQQIVFGFLDQNNYGTQSNADPFGTSLDFKTERNILGLYGNLEFDYEDYLYLTLSARNDWGSTVEAENRSLFYPGASVSFIPTSAFPGMRSDKLGYLKLRASYGSSAGYPNAFQTRPQLNIATASFTDNGGTPLNTNSNTATFPNPDLKPERFEEFELGIEANFFNNRISLDASAYLKTANDQIINRNLDNSTGFETTTINAGEIETEGLEIGLNITPLKSENFSWDINNVFTAYETTVVDLPDDVNQIVYSGFSNLGNAAIEGQPLGVIIGSFAVTDDEGNLLINPEDGNIIASGELGLDDQVVGDPNPDWTLTSINTFRYKDLSLSAQIEYVHGGDFYSGTIGNLLRRGVTTDTEDREGTFVIPGVLADPETGDVLRDANGNAIRNTIQQGANELYFLNFLDPTGQQIYDGSRLRVREVSLSYNVPEKFLDRTPFGSLSLTFTGNNVWYKAFNVPEGTNFDPEVLSTGVGNGQGLEFTTAPNSKRYGFSVKATF
ncbi:SusC/RagA family TonB-linked outer membrane protein [Aquimarina gracilis]|uniref:SusC/RagA family TonB-linked outer membrane protein n=1 Tax=Aquimarina gracilis TaxID=874422 RepID=A0ABU5ZS35_9FLAO|nr:SusC/RagA family TonB-linked outer membrane protein [Aquimarina gracilis]MEB3344891.1 SusC/RagA family TonB-linked outer membrane protein [Aquimarina gracilis]